MVSEKGPAETVIDGMTAGSVVTFQSQEDQDSILEGFTISNGSGQAPSKGGGIFCSSSSPTIRRNVVKQNACYSGAGIYCWNSSSVIVDNTIEQNIADFDGGGVCLVNSDSIIKGNIFRGNVSYVGGGIYSTDSSPDISENYITENYCAMGGGVSMGPGSPVLIDNLITKNTAEWQGGGVEIGAMYSGAVRRNIISENNAPSNGIKGGYGGGIYCYNCSVTLEENVIFKNTSVEKGGGIYLASLSYLGLINNTISSNTSNEGGGGVYASYGSLLEIHNTIMWNDWAPAGKEIYLSNWWGLPSTLTISHTNLGGGKMSLHVDSDCTVNAGPGMIDEDPLFVDIVGGAFHLSWSSPCRDKGDDSLVSTDEDMEGDPRIAFGCADMGADEYYYHLHHSGDVVPGGTIDFTFVGYPSAPVRLAWGQELLDPPITTQHGDLFVWPLEWSCNIGDIPPNGVLNVPVTISPSWAPGTQAHLQALVGPWGVPCTGLTNPVTLTVE